MTIIHQKAYSILENSIKKNSISHFYIFHGPNNVGKKNLAISFVKLLLCENQNLDSKTTDNCPSCKKIDEEKHFDVVFMDSKSSVDGIDENKSDQIRLPHVQEISRIANLGPFMSNYKVFILDAAEKLNNEASNAFLKLLEEPPKSSIFLFLINDLSSIYPTILSRAQKINVLEISKKEIHTHISSNFDIDDSIINKVIHLSLGRIEVAEKLSSDPSLIDGYYESYDRFVEFCRTDISDRMDFAQKFSTRYRTDRNAIFKELDLWIDFCNITMNNLYQDEKDSIFETKLSDMFDTKEINHIVIELIKTISYLKSNANPRLVFDVMSLNLPFYQKEKSYGV
tara:strand:- start:8940 stop:9959 length:1020 start_codon:yes stop_codon:yes gene_type:complete